MRSKHLAALARQLAGEEIHRRLADEARDPGIDRLVVDLARRAELLQFALMHDGDLVGHRHGLELVVRDIDHGRAEGALQMLDLAAHVGPQLGVEMGDRLVEQEELGLAHDGAADGDALLLAAGEFLRAALEQLVDLEQLRRRR